MDLPAIVRSQRRGQWRRVYIYICIYIVHVHIHIVVKITLTFNCLISSTFVILSTLFS